MNCFYNVYLYRTTAANQQNYQINSEYLNRVFVDLQVTVCQYIS